MSAAQLAESLNSNFSEVGTGGGSSSQGQNRRVLRILHWNMGCWAIGASGSTMITTEEYLAIQSKKWKYKLSQLSPDILMACEYMEVFAGAGNKYKNVPNVFSTQTVTVDVSGYYTDTLYIFSGHLVIYSATENKYKLMPMTVSGNGRTYDSMPTGYVPFGVITTQYQYQTSHTTKSLSVATSGWLNEDELSPLHTTEIKTANTGFEYQTGLSSSVLTKDEILGDFPYVYEGGRLADYMGQCFATNQQLWNPQRVAYTSESNRCYIRAELNIGNPAGKKTITLIETHLSWENDEYRASQLQELKTLADSLDRVIIAADFNVDSSSEYEIFTSAGGYTMLNHGSWGDIPTYPATGLSKGIYTSAKPTIPIDNIIVKGCTLSNVQVIDDASLTDHCGIMCDVIIN